MKWQTKHALSATLILTTWLAMNAWADGAKTIHWPSFRGPSAGGVAVGFATPTQWSVDHQENVKWSTPIPGLGHSCPIIWGDRLFVTTAISGNDDPELRVGLYGNIAPVEDDTVHQWKVMCLDKTTGKVLWEQTANQGVPKIKRHTKASHANCTPATDGEHVVAFFGSEGLHCYDMKGNRLWKKDLGVLDSGYYVVPDAQWEFASSPIIYKNRVIVECDVQKDSFIAAFDIVGGNEIWRIKRDEVPTWSTPTLVQFGGRTQVVVNGFRHIGGYDAADGKEIWNLRGGGDIPVPTPVMGHGLIYITNAHGPGAPIYAIRPDAKGDISLKNDATSNEHIAWCQKRTGNYMQTPLVYGDYLYTCRDNGVMSCLDAKTGKKLYRARLTRSGEGFTASPVAADGKIYFTSEMGNVHVIKHGSEFVKLATNAMSEICMATPAISQGVLFFRTQGHVVAVANSSQNTGSR